MSRRFVMGDAHGQIEKIRGHLRRAALIDTEDNWTGGDATLRFIGDFCDRGPDGIGVINLVMSLQAQAPSAGGRVEAILGNHEPLLLGVHRFVDMPVWTDVFRRNWRMNGGNPFDLERVTPQVINWVEELPALILDEDTLYVHADTPIYLRYGSSIEAINTALRRTLASDDPDGYMTILERLSERHAYDGPGGARMALAFLNQFGAKRLIHGHTPIRPESGDPHQVTEPEIYNDGICINVDGGMYRGGPGFLFEVPPR